MKRIMIILTTIFLIGCEEDPTMYTLTVSSNPTEGGTINPSSGEYQEGTEVTLRVNTNTHYEFDKWSGSWSGTESPLTITMDSDKNLVGNFKLMDSDGDGVTDDIDQCPNTEKDVNVDENGCVVYIYLDTNGVTIKSYEYGDVGDTGLVNGITYTIVSREQLITMVENGEDVSRVCTSKISNMRRLFEQKNPNGDISSWDVSSVVDLGGMFLFTDFNGDISNWDVSSVVDLSGLFGYTPFNGDISNWDVSSVINMSGLFQRSEFNGDISNWDVSNVYYMNYMFRNNQTFNQDLSNWDVSSVVECRDFKENTPQWTLPKPNFRNCNF